MDKTKEKLESWGGGQIGNLGRRAPLKTDWIVRVGQRDGGRAPPARVRQGLRRRPLQEGRRHPRHLDAPVFHRVRIEANMPHETDTDSRGQPNRNRQHRTA